MSKRLIELRFLSTLSLRRATRSTRQSKQTCQKFLSTLSLRRATVSLVMRTALILLFLSTLSLRRATGCQRPCGRPTKDFYPRSPCGERRSGLPETRQRDVISIHALLAESDRYSCVLRPSRVGFLSTLSLRRATLGKIDCGKN